MALGGIGDFVQRTLKKAADEGRIGSKVTDSGRATRSARAPGTEGKGRKKKPVDKVVRSEDWSRTPAEEIHEMLQTESGRAALKSIPAKERGEVRRKLLGQNKLWADQFDSVIGLKRTQPSADFDPAKDSPKPKAAEEKPRRTGGEAEYNDKGRTGEALGRKLTREAEGSEAADLASTTRAVEGTSKGIAEAQRPLETEDVVSRRQRPRGLRATPLEINPPLQRSSVAGSTRGSDVIAGGGDGSVALPVAKKVDEGIGVPDEPAIEIRGRDDEINPNDGAPKRKVLRVRVGKGPNKLDGKPSEPEYRARGTRTSGKGETAAGDTVSNKVSEPAREWRRRDAAQAAGFYPNAADSAKRLSSDEIEDAKMDHGTTYNRLGVRATQPAESRFGFAQKEMLKNFPDDGHRRLEAIAGAKTPEHAYAVAFKHALSIVENDMPGVRISETATREAAHGLAQALVRGYGWDTPNTMPPTVARGDAAADLADRSPTVRTIGKGKNATTETIPAHIQPPTKAPVEPGPEPSLKDALRARARARADQRLNVRDSAKVREPQPNEFPLRDAPDKEVQFAEPVGPTPASEVNEASLSEFEKQLYKIVNRGAGASDSTPTPKQSSQPAPATDPDDLADEIPDPFTGGEDAQPVEVNADLTRKYRDIFPLRGRKSAGGGGKKPPETAAAAAAGDDGEEIIRAPSSDGLDPVPVGGVEAGRQRRGAAADQSGETLDGMSKEQWRSHAAANWSTFPFGAKNFDEWWSAALARQSGSAPAPAAPAATSAPTPAEGGELPAVPSQTELAEGVRRGKTPTVRPPKSEMDAAARRANPPRVSPPQSELDAAALRDPNPSGPRPTVTPPQSEMTAAAMRELPEPTVTPPPSEMKAAARRARAATKPRQAPTSTTEPPPAEGAPPAAPPPGDGTAGRPSQPPPQEYENVVLSQNEDGGWAFRSRSPIAPQYQPESYVPSARTSQYTPGGGSADFIPPSQVGASSTFIPPSQVGASSTLIPPSQVGASSAFIPQSQFGAHTNIANQGAHSTFIHPVNVGAHTQLRTILPGVPGAHSPVPLPSAAFHRHPGGKIVDYVRQHPFKVGLPAAAWAGYGLFRSFNQPQHEQGVPDWSDNPSGPAPAALPPAPPAATGLVPAASAIEAQQADTIRRMIAEDRERAMRRSKIGRTGTEVWD